MRARRGLSARQLMSPSRVCPLWPLRGQQPGSLAGFGPAQDRQPGRGFFRTLPGPGRAVRLSGWATSCGGRGGAFVLGVDQSHALPALGERRRGGGHD